MLTDAVTILFRVGQLSLQFLLYPSFASAAHLEFVDVEPVPS